jgi:hypothetical protein
MHAPAPAVRTPAARGHEGGQRSFEGGQRSFEGGHRSFNEHGVRHAAPDWDARRVHGFNRRFDRFPGFRSFGSFGLAGPLVAYPGLAFLSAGLLASTYVDADDFDRTVYVYIVNEDGQDVEYRVDDAGQILSREPVEMDYE